MTPSDHVDANTLTKSPSDAEPEQSHAERDDAPPEEEKDDDQQQEQQEPEAGGVEQAPNEVVSDEIDEETSDDSRSVLTSDDNDQEHTGTVVRRRRDGNAFLGEPGSASRSKGRYTDDDGYNWDDDEYIGLIPMLCARCGRWLRRSWSDQRSKRFIVIVNVILGVSIIPSATLSFSLRVFLFFSIGCSCNTFIKQQVSLFLIN